MEAITNWFHVFKSMIESGDVRRLGANAFTIYCVIKAYTDFTTGNAFPSISLIQDKTGFSKSTVIRSLKKLEELGYLSKHKEGRKNIYTLREKIQIKDDEGRPTAVATWDYLPQAVSEAQAELKNFLLTGQQDFRYIKIDTLNLTLNIQHGNNNEQINFNLDNITDPKLKELIQRIEKKRKKDAQGDTF